MTIPTLLRTAEHTELAKLSLSGKILDLGGDDRAAYRTLMKGDHSFVTVNLDEKTRPDFFHDLEQLLPFQNAQHDHVLLINVLEHVYNYRQLLTEAVRVVRPGGTVVLVVPFLFPIHPSPQDYWRFSEAALRRLCDELDLQVESCTALGSGVFGARYLMLDRLLPKIVRFVLRFVHPVIKLLDSSFAHLAGVLGKEYVASDYALGYCVVARKR